MIKMKKCKIDQNHKKKPKNYKNSKMTKIRK